MKQLTISAALALGALGAAALTTASALAQPAGDKPAVVRDAEAKAKGKKPGAPAPAGPSQVQAEVAAHDRALAAINKQEKTTVELSFSTRPVSGAKVYYGKKLLGTTPFTVQWKHDTGPVDVVVRAPGYLPVNTRAYTFRDEEVAVELTRPSDASKLLGYRKKIEAVPEDEPAAGEETVVAPAGAAGPATPTAVPRPIPRAPQPAPAPR